MDIDHVISVPLIPVIRSVPGYCLTPEGEDALDASLLWDDEMTDSEQATAAPCSAAYRAGPD